MSVRSAPALLSARRQAGCAILDGPSLQAAHLAHPQSRGGSHSDADDDRSPASASIISPDAREQQSRDHFHAHVTASEYRAYLEDVNHPRYVRQRREQRRQRRRARKERNQRRSIDATDSGSASRSDDPTVPFSIFVTPPPSVPPSSRASLVGSEDMRRLHQDALDRSSCVSESLRPEPVLLPQLVSLVGKLVPSPPAAAASSTMTAATKTATVSPRQRVTRLRHATTINNAPRSLASSSVVPRVAALSTRSPRSVSPRFDRGVHSNTGGGIMIDTTNRSTPKLAYISRVYRLHERSATTDAAPYDRSHKDLQEMKDDHPGVAAASLGESSTIATKFRFDHSVGVGCGTSLQPLYVEPSHAAYALARECLLACAQRGWSGPAPIFDLTDSSSHEGGSVSYPFASFLHLLRLLASTQMCAELRTLETLTTLHQLILVLGFYMRSSAEYRHALTRSTGGALKGLLGIFDLLGQMQRQDAAVVVIATESLTTALHHRRNDAQLAILEVLAAIVSCQESTSLSSPSSSCLVDHLLSLGLLSTLVDSIDRPATLPLLHASLRIATQLITTHRRSKAFAQHSVFIPAVLHVMRDHPLSVSVHESCTECITQLLTQLDIDIPSRHRLLLESADIGVRLFLAAHTNFPMHAAIQRRFLAFLSRVSNEHLVKRRLLQLGVAEKVVETMKRFDDSAPIQTQAMQTLSNLVVGESVCGAQLMGAEIMSLVVHALATHSADAVLVENALLFLRALLFLGVQPAHVAQFLKHDGLRHIGDAMRTHSRSHRIVAHAWHLLRMLAGVRGSSLVGLGESTRADEPLASTTDLDHVSSRSLAVWLAAFAHIPDLLALAATHMRYFDGHQSAYMAIARAVLELLSSYAAQPVRISTHSNPIDGLMQLQVLGALLHHMHRYRDSTTTVTIVCDLLSVMAAHASVAYAQAHFASVAAEAETIIAQVLPLYQPPVRATSAIDVARGGSACHRLQASSSTSSSPPSSACLASKLSKLRAVIRIFAPPPPPPPNGDPTPDSERDNRRHRRRATNLSVNVETAHHMHARSRSHGATPVTRRARAGENM